MLAPMSYIRVCVEWVMFAAVEGGDDQADVRRDIVAWMRDNGEFYAMNANGVTSQDLFIMKHNYIHKRWVHPFKKQSITHHFGLMMIYPFLLPTPQHKGGHSFVI